MQQIVLILPILLLLSMCAPLDYFTGNQTVTHPAKNITPPRPPPPVNITPQNTTPPQNITPPPPPPVNVTPPNVTAPNTTEEDLQTWNAINTNVVEQECLVTAKAQTGMYSSMQKCTCDETWMVGIKNYVCTITTLQGGIPVTISCVQAKRACTWSSAYWNGSMSFDQIRQFLAQG